MKHVFRYFIAVCLIQILGVTASFSEELDLTCKMIEETVLGQSPPINTNNTALRLLVNPELAKVTLTRQKSSDVRVTEDLITFKVIGDIFTVSYDLNRYTGILRLHALIGEASYQCEKSERKF